MNRLLARLPVVIVIVSALVLVIHGPIHQFAHYHDFADRRRIFVGVKQAAAKNRTLCITASKEEYEAYVDLVTNNSAVAKSYVCYFGDIYLTNPRLLTDFDIVTMVHLCEFSHPNTASAEYGGLTDRQLLDLFTAKTRPGGHIIFYMYSKDFHVTKPVIEGWEREAPVKRVEDFKTLWIYRKS